MDAEISELEKIDADRADGVGGPATGIGFLMLKQLAGPVEKAGARDCPKCGKGHDADHKGNTCTGCGADLPAAADAAKSLPDWHAEAVALVKKAMTRGKVDETQDIDGGQQAIALVGKLIGYEAQELAAGNLGEVADIGLLAEAAQLLRQRVSGELAVQDGNVMPATALMQSAAPETATSPTGDADTAKSEIAKDGTDVDTVTQTGELTELVKAADAKAAALEKRVTDFESLAKALEGRLAKVEAAAVPGGPVMSVTRPKAAGDGEDHAAKALYYDEWAEKISDPSQKDHYRQLAAQERAKIPS